MSGYETVVQREQKVFMPGVRRWPLALERGLGSKVWDMPTPPRLIVCAKLVEPACLMSRSDI